MTQERQEEGFALVELLVVTLIMSFISAAAFGMLGIVMQDSNKIQNRCDSIDNVKNTIDKISREVRMGRCFGDVFGAQVTNTFNGIPTTTYQGTMTFPDNQNPIYPNATPPGGWPRWADGTQPSGLSAYVLSNQTLIVQRPVFDANGFPLAIPSGQGSPAVPANTVNVVTDIYRVMPDPNNAGEWIMQWCQLPGLTVPGYVPQTFGPITLCSGIIGPIDTVTNQPKAFEYLMRSQLDPTGTAHSPNDGTMTGTSIGVFSGVIVNLEVQSHRNSARVNGQWKHGDTLAFKQEAYLRNNALVSPIPP